MEILNRKAHFNYFVEDTYVAGIVLQGKEVKALRDGKANISEAFCQIIDNEVFLINSHIAKWIEDYSGYDEFRQRKLLLNKKEIKKIGKEIQPTGMTLIPLKIFFDEHNRAKVLIGICKGKHDYDKRETIKQRDIERDNNMKF